MSFLGEPVPIKSGHQQVTSIIKGDTLHGVSSLQNHPLDEIHAKITDHVGPRSSLATKLGTRGLD